MPNTAQKFAVFGQVIESSFDLSPCAKLKSGTASVTVTVGKVRIPKKSYHRLFFLNKKTYAYYYKNNLNYFVRFPEQGTFQISKNGKRLIASFSEKINSKERSVLTLNHVLPLCLSLQKKLVLHAAAIVVKKEARLICAPAGTGKSTLAKYFYKQGFQILSDDACVIRKQRGLFNTLPSTPLIRTWNKKTEKKLTLQLDNKKALKAYPIRTIAFPRLGAKKMRKLSALEVSPLLLAQVFRISFDAQNLKNELNLTVSIGSQIPCFEIPYQHNRSALKKFSKDFLK